MTTSSIPSKTALRASTRTISEVIDNMTSKACWYRFDENTGVTIEDSFGVYPDLTIQNPQANLWTDNEFWATFGATNLAFAQVINDADIEELLRTDNLAEGGILICGEFEFSAVPSANEFLFAAFAPFTGNNGGFGVRSANVGDKLELKSIGSADGSVETKTSAAIPANDAVHHIAAFCDVSNGVYDLILNGSVDASSTTATTVIAPTTNYGLCIGGVGSGAAGNTANTTCGNGRNVKCRNFMVIRFETDVSADIEDICAGLKANPGNLPWILEKY